MSIHKEKLAKPRGDLAEYLDFREWLGDHVINLIGRIELAVLGGEDCGVIGPTVDRWDFTLSTPTVDVVEMARKISRLAQCDCDAIGLNQRYGVLVYDARKSQHPIARWVIPTKPAVNRRGHA